MSEAKVRDFELEATVRKPGYHEVAGFEIEVQQIKVLSRDQGFLALQGDFPEVIESKRFTLDHFADGVAGQEFHHDVGAVIINAGLEDGHEVRVLQGCQRGRFPEHGPGGVFLDRVTALGKDSLDGDFTIELAIEGTVNGTDTSLADLATDFIAVHTHHQSCQVSRLLRWNQAP